MKQIEEIKKMTYSELQDELLNCDNNPVKESIIKKIMELKRKQNIISNSVKNNTNKNSKNTTNRVPDRVSDRVPDRVPDRVEDNYNIDELLDEIQYMDSDYDSDYETEYISRFKDTNVDELLSNIMFNQEDQSSVDNRPVNSKPLIDNKFKSDIEKDVINNHITDRMNNNIFINNLHKNRIKGHFISPFID